MRIKRVIFYFVCCLAIVSCQSVNKAPKDKSAITKPTILATKKQNKKAIKIERKHTQVMDQELELVAISVDKRNIAVK